MYKLQYYTLITFQLLNCWVSYTFNEGPKLCIEYKNKSSIIKVEEKFKLVKIIVDERPWEEEKYDPRTKTLYISAVRLLKK
jgi:hypothetical protein